MKMSYQHLFHAAILKIVLDGAERAENDTLYLFKVILQTQHIKQSVNIVQRLFNLFDKEDDIMFACEMYLRSCYSRIA